MSKKIGILTGGGDCPGLNAVIRGCCITADKYGYDVLGFLDGFEGLYNKEFVELHCVNVDSILNIGGTILGSSNTGHFNVKPIPEDVVKQCVDHYVEIGLACIVCIGGDGTMSLAYELSTHGIHIVGVPKTIDNDLRSTDQTFGFDSAVSIVTDALDRLHTTACSHHRAIVVEVMGRNAGWIALASAVAGGAHACLIPEQEWTWEALLKFIAKRHKKHRNYSIIVVSEGAKLPDSSDQVMIDEKRLGGVGNVVASKIQSELDIPCRCTVLGHIQRGGTPSSYDRILASKYGIMAGELACTGQYGKMASLKGTKIRSVDITAEMADQKLIDMQNDQLVHSARLLGINFGAEKLYEKSMQESGDSE